MGVAWLGMTPEEFFICRIGHFFSALAYYSEKKKREVRLISELMRLQTTDLLNIQIKKSERIKPGQLWKFPWDEEEEEEKPELIDEEIRQLNEQIIKDIYQ